MELLNQHLALVRDGLYARNMKEVDCFVFNKSSEKVKEIGEPILPALEHVIREEVMPNCSFDLKAQHEAFPGLGNLMVDYFQIVKEAGHLKRAARFVSSLHGAVLVEAIRFISMEWDHVIPEPFMTIVERASNAGSPEEREIALWALDWHVTNKGKSGNGQGDIGADKG